MAVVVVSTCRSGPALYQRSDSAIWWITYTTADGHRVRESTKTADRDTAQRILDDKRGCIARGETILPRVDKVTYDEAKVDLRAYYETHKTRDITEADQRLAHLDPFFTGRRLVTITPDIITAYARTRQNEKAANGTINRSWRPSASSCGWPTSTASSRGCRS